MTTKARARKRRAATPQIEAPELPPEAIAFRLASAVAGQAGALVIARTAERAEGLALALQCFAPELEVAVLPPWSCLPYDRVSPSRESMGRRVAVLQRMLQRKHALVVIASVEAAIQRVPPKAVLRAATFRIAAGAPLDREGLSAFAARTGYIVDDRVDEPGEIAFRGAVVDIFPAAAPAPFRLMLEDDGTIGEILHYDPLTQRTEEAVPEIVLGPASELIHAEAPEQMPASGAEHRLTGHYGKLETLFGFMPSIPLFVEPGAGERVGALWEQIEEAFAAARDFGTGGKPADPAGLYLDDAAWSRAVARREALAVSLEGIVPGRRFADAEGRGAAVSTYVADQVATDRRVVLGGRKTELRAIRRMLGRNTGAQPEPAETWAAAPGPLSSVVCDLQAGFIDELAKIALIAGPDVLGRRQGEREGAATSVLGADMQLGIGDVVVHEDHGVGILQAIESIDVEEGKRDVVRLEYHGGASVLVPIEEFGKLWRYGGDPEAVSLDRLHTDAWRKRRAEISVAVDEAATALVDLARKRLERKVEPIVPPAVAYQRLSARFPYQETADQAAAVDAVLGDLRSGLTMDRLVCGDVGFGKTEVALRAAAAVALAGQQVAFVAPTTVLVRQHLQSLERRFAGTNIRIGHLSRLVSSAEAAEVKEKLAAGELDIVVGTHAVAADGVQFKRLGLVIIDEEQRFGAKIKQKLRSLAEGIHVLALSATPIPRTLQGVLAGLQDVSVIATPPARRRAIRTFVAEFDGATARLALLREKRRGGQSFLVVPRIEDMEPMRAQLKEIAPELSVIAAHGEMPAADIDKALIDFANGEGDVLLATNIVESGLDVPRANTMLIWRADRFGLAQLHQLRGRVGRGAAQGVAYLFTAPGEEISDATRRRLGTLETLDRLGAGFEISARDLDQRGAGDLMGEEQAGHLQLIGAGLYQTLLERALRLAKGEADAMLWRPRLNLGVSGAIPAEYVPEPSVRIDLYARLQRMTTPREIRLFADELEDRFGELPEETQRLLATAQLAIAAGAIEVEKIDAGPAAVALTFRRTPEPTKLEPLLTDELGWKDERLVLRQATGDDERVAAAAALVRRVSEAVAG